MSTVERLKRWADALKRDVLALWLAARDTRTPTVARLVALAVAGYALSPIDLIPDFIPVLGLIDDLLLVPAGIWLAMRLIPPPLLAEFRAEAAMRPWPRSLTGAVAIVGIWIALAVLLACAWSG